MQEFQTLSCLIPWTQHPLWSFIQPQPLEASRWPLHSLIGKTERPWNWQSWCQPYCSSCLSHLARYGGHNLTGEEVGNFESLTSTRLVQTLRHNSYSLIPWQDPAEVLLHVSLLKVPNLLDSCPSSVLHASPTQGSPGSPSLMHHSYTDSFLRYCFWKTDLRRWQILKLKCLQLGDVVNAVIEFPHPSQQGSHFPAACPSGNGSHTARYPALKKIKGIHAFAQDLFIASVRNIWDHF